MERKGKKGKERKRREGVRKLEGWRERWMDG